jgi:hypothetical protein
MPIDIAVDKAARRMKRSFFVILTAFLLPKAVEVNPTGTDISALSFFQCYTVPTVPDINSIDCDRKQ